MLRETKWWEIEDETRVHETLFPVIQKIKERQAFRNADNLKWAKLYGNTDILGLNSAQYAQPNPVAQANRVTWNVLQSCVDTQAAKIAKNKPLPKFLTEDGNWEQAQRAQNLNRFIAGSFYQAKTFESSARSFIHGAVFGTGLKKVFPQGKRIVSEATLPDELIVDDAEAWDGNPRNLYQQKPVSRDILLSEYPKFETAIYELKSVAGVAGYASYDHADQVEVFEAWHLPTLDKDGKPGKDGRHVIIINGATLMSERWEWHCFPFAKFLHVPKLIGWFGQGVPERHVGSQIEINKILKNIQTAHHLGSNFVVLKEKNSKVSSGALTNEIGVVVNFEGTPPTIQAFQTVHPEIYQHLERLAGRVYDIEGVSQLSANSQKPAGLNSGKALREYNDIESERFFQVGQRYEQFHMDEAELHILCAKTIAKKYPDYAVPARDSNSIEFIQWKDVDLDRDAYVMQCFPTSSLPREPFARMQYVQELATSGYIDQDTTIELMDFPDLTQYQSLRLAKRKWVRQAVYKILSKGESIIPEPFIDVSYALQYAQLSLNDAMINNAPEDRRELLRIFIGQVQSLIEAAQPGANAGANPSPAPGGAPVDQPGVGVPPAPPVGPMMPQAQ
jgi:hypothetical protein